MREIAPNYYSRFQCIASAGRHSCCIGWEIDVDEESLAKYSSLPGTLGGEIRESVVSEGECAHFRLGEGERCPFLDGQNLCRLILDGGEELLCQICRDHPRFRSEFSHCEEIGLGLSCEAAARLVLSQEKPMTLVTLSDDGVDEQPNEEENALLALRTSLLALLENGEHTVEKRLDDILDVCGAFLPERSWAEWEEIYRALERLDRTWDDVLDTLTLPEQPLGAEWDRPFLNLAAYFIYRHLPSALADGAPHAHVAFAVLSTRIIRHLFAVSDTHDMETLTELARMYSAEIEYSDENTDILLDSRTSTNTC